MSFSHADSLRDYGVVRVLGTDKQSIYRIVRDQIAAQVKHQTPFVYGRDRLLFFDNREPFSATPLVAQIANGTISLPIGKIHRVLSEVRIVTPSRRIDSPAAFRTLRFISKEVYCKRVRLFIPNRHCQFGLGVEFKCSPS